MANHLKKLVEKLEDKIEKLNLKLKTTVDPNYVPPEKTKETPKNSL